MTNIVQMNNFGNVYPLKQLKSLDSYEEKVDQTMINRSEILLTLIKDTKHKIYRDDTLAHVLAS